MKTTVEFMEREKVEEAALALLNRHDLLGNAAVNPVAVASAEGIEVFSIQLSDDSVCGILRKERDQYCIYVNADHHPHRMRYTIAHEIGHYVLHRDIVETFVDKEINLYRKPQSLESARDRQSAMMEVQANMFAAALLMPGPSVRKQYAHTKDIQALAKMFGVSREAMGHRISNLGLQ